MVYVKIKTDNIELNISSDDHNIEAEDFLESMKSVIDMVVEAESDIAYNNQDEVWDTEEQSDIFNSIMSKSELMGTNPIMSSGPTPNVSHSFSFKPNETTTSNADLTDSISAFLMMLNSMKGN